MSTRNSNRNYPIKPDSPARWKINFVEELTKNKRIIEKLLPLDIMKLTGSDLTKQFTVTPGKDEYTSRELVFKFYETDNCRVFNLVGSHSVNAIIGLLSELPPVYIFHSELSLAKEEFLDLDKLSVLNAIYCITGSYGSDLFIKNMEKVIEADLQFYFDCFRRV